MTSRRPRLALAALAGLLLLAIATVGRAHVEATDPSFVVELSAPWPAANDPWLQTLELLREHDQTAYEAALPLVSTAINPTTLLRNASLGLSELAIESIRLGVDMGEAGPRLQALASTFDASSVLSEGCPTWAALVDDVITCDFDYLVTALGDPATGQSTPMLQQLDTLLGTRSRQAVILVMHPRLDEFPELWNRFLDLRVLLALRYTPVYTPDVNSVRIVGYHAHLNVKDLEYKALDDRDLFGAKPAVGSSLPALDDGDYDNLSAKVAAQARSLAELSRIATNYPTSLAKLDKEVQVAPDLAKALTSNSAMTRQLVHEGSALVLLNGQPIPTNMFNFWNVLAHIRHDSRILDHTKKQNISRADVLNVFSADHPMQATDRFNLCNTDAVVWLNDLQTDAMYSRWPTALRQLVMMAPRLPTLRKNLLNLVYFADLADPAQVQTVLEMVELIRNETPIRFGIVPIATANNIDSPSSTKAIKFAATARQAGVARAIDLLSSPEETTVDQVETAAKDEKALHAMLAAALDQFDVSPSSGGLMFLNGRVVQQMGGSAWQEAAGALVQDELRVLSTAVMYGELSDSSDISRHYCGSDAWTSRKAFVFDIDAGKESNLPAFTAPTDNLLGDYKDVHVSARGRLSPAQRQAVVAAHKALGFGLDSLDPVMTPKKTGPGLVVNGRVFDIPAQLLQRDVELLVKVELKRRVLRLRAAASAAMTTPQFWRVSALSHLDHTELTAIYGRMFPAGRTLLSTHSLCQEPLACFTDARSATPDIELMAFLPPISDETQKIVPILDLVHRRIASSAVKVVWRTVVEGKIPRRFTRFVHGLIDNGMALFERVPANVLYTLAVDAPRAWVTVPQESVLDLDNLRLVDKPEYNFARFELDGLLVEGHTSETTGDQAGEPPRGLQLVLEHEPPLEAPERDPQEDSDEPITVSQLVDASIVMYNYGYFQLRASSPTSLAVRLRSGRATKLFKPLNEVILVDSFRGVTLFPKFERLPGQEKAPILVDDSVPAPNSMAVVHYAKQAFSKFLALVSGNQARRIHVFSLASGKLYERLLSIMMQSVVEKASIPVTFYLVADFLSPEFIRTLPALSAKFSFDYTLVRYAWPAWLRSQSVKQRRIWGYKVLFLDVLFPLVNGPDRIIFVDADQVVRADLAQLMNLDMQGNALAATPFCDDRKEMDGFRFWKQDGGFWQNHLQGKPYFISALYVVDLVKLRQRAVGDILRAIYQQLSADPGSLSNLDQDLLNYAQHQVPIFPLDQSWLWCQTWCSDESLARAKTIDLCNNPMSKDSKLDRARSLIPEWVRFDDRAEQVRMQVNAPTATTAVPEVQQQHPPHTPITADREEL
ncbi:hypothetical protein BC828DRAFT_416271 [Blastocladiella britannica]|nr:hypothetical protein BC828DRAFT_416271 [Blastocladiella britannica]